MWEIPVFMGQRVMMNPEDMRASRIGDKQGTIIEHIGDTRLMEWQQFTEEHHKQIAVNIKWDDGQESNFYLKRLIPIGYPTEEHIVIHFKDTARAVRGVRGEEAFEKQLDEQIIKNGKKIVRENVYGNDYRRKILEANFKHYEAKAIGKGLSTQEADTWMLIQKTLDEHAPVSNPSDVACNLGDVVLNDSVAEGISIHEDLERAFEGSSVVQDLIRQYQEGTRVSAHIYNDASALDGAQPITEDEFRRVRDVVADPFDVGVAPIPAERNNNDDDDFPF